MSATHDMVAKVVTNLGHVLKAAGYRKQRFNFRQEVSPTTVRLVNVQSSQWNMGKEARFTINLGVYHRDLAALHDAIAPCDSPSVHHCLIQQRLGLLMPIRKDYWWAVNTRSDLAAVAAEVADTWSKYGQPWLEAHTSLTEARRFLLGYRFYFLAAMASLALGDVEDSKSLLERTVQDAPEMKERVDTWRKVHLPTA